MSFVILKIIKNNTIQTSIMWYLLLSVGTVFGRMFTGYLKERHTELNPIVAH